MMKILERSASGVRTRWLTTFLLLGLSLLPTRAFAGGNEAEGGELIWQAANLVIVLALLFYYGRKPIIEFFASRRAAITHDLDSAAQLLEQAESRNASIQRRLIDLDAQREEIRENTRRRAEDESEQILAEARLSAERIRDEASSAIDQELRRAHEELRREAADLALELAANLLREKITDMDRERLVDEFVTRIEAAAQD